MKTLQKHVRHASLWLLDKMERSAIWLHRKSGGKVETYKIRKIVWEIRNVKARIKKR